LVNGLGSRRLFGRGAKRAGLLNVQDVKDLAMVKQTFRFRRRFRRMI